MTYLQALSVTDFLKAIIMTIGWMFGVFSYIRHEEWRAWAYWVIAFVALSQLPIPAVIFVPMIAISFFLSWVVVTSVGEDNLSMFYGLELSEKQFHDIEDALSNRKKEEELHKTCNDLANECSGLKELSRAKSLRLDKIRADLTTLLIWLDAKRNEGYDLFSHPQLAVRSTLTADEMLKKAESK